MSRIIENARITSTMLGVEDHGIMTCYLFLKFENCNNCGFGGYELDVYDKEEGRRVGTAAGMQMIAEILETVGVKNWEDLLGTYVRCEFEGYGGKITRIGNIIKDKWFSLEDFFAEWEKRETK